MIDGLPTRYRVADAAYLAGAVAVFFAAALSLPPLAAIGAFVGYLYAAGWALSQLTSETSDTPAADLAEEWSR